MTDQESCVILREMAPEWLKLADIAPIHAKTGAVNANLLLSAEIGGVCGRMAKAATRAMFETNTRTMKNCAVK